MALKSIVFLTSSHPPLDDRIFYHLANSLSNCYHVFIVTTTEEITKSVNNIELRGCDGAYLRKKTKIDYFFDLLKNIKPCIIICSEPLPIIAAHHYKKRIAKDVSIIYDVTEWYPSKKNLYNMVGVQKVITFFKLLFFNIYASFLTDGFIFGEYFKGIPYKILFFYKRWKEIGYYPDLKYIKYTKPGLKDNKICLGYTGVISTEKGIKNVMAVAQAIKNKQPGLTVKLKIIGWFNNKNDENEFYLLPNSLNNIEIEMMGRQNFEVFSEKLMDIDVFFDLRKIDIENTHCLPIKLFYYAAYGRPVIYSNLKAIRRVVQVEEFGYLVNPLDTNLISDYVINYISQPVMYYKHCEKARSLAETKYNWKLIEPAFINFIDQLNN